MPYKLRISEEEVRAELEKMGFTSIPGETVEVFRRGQYLFTSVMFMQRSVDDLL